MQMTFEPSKDHPGALIGRLSGTFDIVAADEFWNEASRLVDPETRYVVFDLTDLSIMTSAGLGILVRLYARLKDYGGGMAIFGCIPKVHETFSIVMIDTVLNVSDTETEAWQAIQA
jgi:anti-anti-sigma factor